MNDFIYYEFADDLLGRKDAANPRQLPQFWNGSAWETTWDSVRWSFTAQKIDNPAEFKARNPQFAKAFATP